MARILKFQKVPNSKNYILVFFFLSEKYTQTWFKDETGKIKKERVKKQETYILAKASLNKKTLRFYMNCNVPKSN